MMTYTTANETTQALMHTAYMNPYVTTLTIKEVPHKRVYPKELKPNDSIAIFVNTSTLICEGYFVWKTIGAVAHNKQHFYWIFTDGTVLKQSKRSPSKLEVMI
jgi:hypothetical protein